MDLPFTALTSHYISREIYHSWQYAIPTWVLPWPLFLHTPSAVFTEGSVGRAHTWVRLWGGVSVSALCVGIQRTVKAAWGSCRWTQMLFIYLSMTLRVYSWDTQSFNVFHYIFAFSKAACSSDPGLHPCPFFTRWYKGQRHCDRWETKVLQNSKISTKACTFFMFLGVG